MAVLFDASDLLARDRVDAYDAAMNSVTFPTCAQLNDDGRNAHARIENWDLGVGINVVQAVTSGQKIKRTAAQIRKAASEDIAIGMTISGAGRSRQGDRDYEIAGSVNPIHGMEPFEIEFTAGETTPSIAMCVNIDLHRLGLPMDVVRAALPNLPASQLYPFFQDHLSGLARAAAEVEDTPAAVMLGYATTELTRAWVASSSPDDRLVREGLASVLGRRIDDYIRRNLTDHSLTAKRIAAEHSISLRYLYALFAKRGQSLEQHILHERLEYARIQLAHTAFNGRSIQSVAYSCGFVHPQHFTLRFRDAYGMTPRQWREMHRPSNRESGFDSD